VASKRAIFRMVDKIAPLKDRWEFSSFQSHAEARIPVQGFGVLRAFWQQLATQLIRQ
jgi:hypothetical protein